MNRIPDILTILTIPATIAALALHVPLVAVCLWITLAVLAQDEPRRTSTALAAVCALCAIADAIQAAP